MTSSDRRPWVWRHFWHVSPNHRITVNKMKIHSEGAAKQTWPHFDHDVHTTHHTRPCNTSNHIVPRIHTQLFFVQNRHRIINARGRFQNHALEWKHTPSVVENTSAFLNNGCSKKYAWLRMLGNNRWCAWKTVWAALSSLVRTQKPWKHGQQMTVPLKC